METRAKNAKNPCHRLIIIIVGIYLISLFASINIEKRISKWQIGQPDCGAKCVRAKWKFHFICHSRAEKKSEKGKHFRFSSSSVARAISVWKLNISPTSFNVSTRNKFSCNCRCDNQRLIWPDNTSLSLAAATELTFHTLGRLLPQPTEQSCVNIEWIISAY